MSIDVARPARARRLVWQAPIALALVALAVVAVGGRPELASFAYLALVSAELGRVDLAEHRLPNALVVPGLAVALIGTLFGWWRTGEPPVTAALCALGTGAVFLVMHVAGGLGMGDVKLGVLLGACLGALGPLAALVAPFVAFLAAGAGALVALATGAGSGERMPFGPFLLFGFWSAVLMYVCGVL
jgi:leader peptidase (prepilin peptidase)/N-methyltransferase